MAAETPLIFDTRPEGHGSFGVLPKLGQNEYDRLADFYGFRHLTEHGYDRATKGQKYFGLWAIELKAGPAIFQPMVVKKTNTVYPPSNPQEGTLVWNSWPGADPLPGEAEGPHYKSNGVHCWTDQTGSCGWGYGGGSHIGTCSTAILMAQASTMAYDLDELAEMPDHETILYSLQSSVGYDNPKSDENPDGQDLADYKDDLAAIMAASGNCGVHTFWCNSGGGFVGSDGFDRDGWWDDHITPNPMWREEIKGGSGGDPGADYYYVIVNSSGVTIAYAPMTAGAPGAVPEGGYMGLLNMNTDEIEYYVETFAGSPQ